MEKNRDSRLIVFLFLIISFFCASASFAKVIPKHSYKETTYPCQGQECSTLLLYGSIMGGAAWAQVGQSLSFVDDATNYSYNADTSTQRVYALGASAGEELRFSPDWYVQIGISYYQTTDFDATGTVTQGVDAASSNTYRYDYSVTARQYLLESKILGGQMYGFHPYLTVGVGASFNSVNSYDVTVNSPFPFSTFTPQYDGNTNISFSYAAGVGVDFDVSKYARIGLGYHYAWFGNAYLGDGEINTVDISQSLGQAKLNASMALLQLTLLI